MAVMRLGDGRWCCRWRCFGGGGGGREEAGVRERNGGRSKVEKESFVCGGGGFCSLFPCALASLASTVCSRNTLGLSGERDHTQGARSPSLGLGASSLQKDGRRERERERGGGERMLLCTRLVFQSDHRIDTTLSFQHSPRLLHGLEAAAAGHGGLLGVLGEHSDDQSAAIAAAAAIAPPSMRGAAPELRRRRDNASARARGRRLRRRRGRCSGA